MKRTRFDRARDENGSILPLTLILIIVMSLAGVAVLQQESSAPAAQSVYANIRTTDSATDASVDGLIQRIAGDTSWYESQTPNCADPSKPWASMGTMTVGSATYNIMCKAQSAPPTATVTHDLTQYAMFAVNYIRVNGCGTSCNYSSIYGDIGVNSNDPGSFSVSLNMCANKYLRLSANSEVIANSISGDGNNCQLQNTTVFTNNALGGTNWTATNPGAVVRPMSYVSGSSYIVDLARNGTCRYILPWPGDVAACGALPSGQTSIDMTGAPSSFGTTGCSGSDVTTNTTIGPGTYNNVTVPTGGTITLQGPGTFTFCSVSLASAGSILRVTGSRTYVLVHQTVSLDGGNVYSPPDTTWFIRGETTKSTDTSLDFGNGSGTERGTFVVGGDTACDANGDLTCKGAGNVAMPGTTTLYGHVYARTVIDGGGAGVFSGSSAPRLVMISVCAMSGTARAECTTGRPLLHALVKITGTGPSNATVAVLSWTRNPT